MSNRSILISLCLYFFANSAFANPTVYQSSQKQTVLLELFTSEGCSSCPAADKWMAKLIDHKKLWEEIIPIAFHVDYWDQLGWRDKFARLKHSQRQRTYQAQGNARAVYTPGFFVNGKEWRSWFSNPTLTNTSTPKVGILTATINKGTLKVKYNPIKSSNKALSAHIAYLGINIDNKIERGENSGKILKHTFVVLKHKTIAANSKSPLKWEFAYNPKKYKGYKPKAIAIWVSELQNPAPIQAVGGWIK